MIIVKMKLKKLYKTGAIVVALGIIIAVAVTYYMFNMPHRNVQATKADYIISSSQIVDEYLTNTADANVKYLAANGDSKILEITGVVHKISEDFNNQKVVLLKDEGDKAGVSATFTFQTNINASNIKIGETVTIKGVIRSGASYDEDLELYENVILEKSDVVTK